MPKTLPTIRHPEFDSGSALFVSFNRSPACIYLEGFQDRTSASRQTSSEGRVRWAQFGVHLSRRRIDDPRRETVQGEMWISAQGQESALGAGLACWRQLTSARPLGDFGPILASPATPSRAAGDQFRLLASRKLPRHPSVFRRVPISPGRRPFHRPRGQPALRYSSSYCGQRASSLCLQSAEH